MGKVLTHPTISRAWSGSQLPAALAAWISAASPPDNDIRAGLRALRARSRDAAQNDDHMRAFLRLIEVNVVGRCGFNVQAKPRSQTGRADMIAAKAIEEALAEQSERGAWDITGQLSRSGFDRLGLRTTAMDGEVLIRIHEGDPEAPTGFAVELIDSEALDLDYSDDLRNGHRVRMGVEMTPRRRPVAYHLFAESDARGGFGTYRTGERVRVPAADIIHAYLPEWVWGTRGIPWASTALRRMAMLAGYEEAAITAARAAAVKGAKYTYQEWADPNAMPGGAALPQGGISQDLSPGSNEVVPYGMDLQPLDWSWPNTDHGAFVKEALRGIASGLGPSYNALASDLEGVSYSSLRQGALAERDLWMTLQDWWIDWVTRPIYLRWLAYALRTGRVSRRNGSAYGMDQWPGLSRVLIQGRRWPWVDPAKDLDAASMSVALGVQSVSAIIREAGRDPDDVWEELAADLERLRAMGLNPGDAVKYRATADPEQPTPPEEGQQ